MFQNKILGDEIGNESSIDKKSNLYSICVSATRALCRNRWFWLPQPMSKRLTTFFPASKHCFQSQYHFLSSCSYSSLSENPTFKKLKTAWKYFMVKKWDTHTESGMITHSNNLSSQQAEAGGSKFQDSLQWIWDQIALQENLPKKKK